MCFFLQLVTRHSPLATSPSPVAAHSFTPHEHRILSAGIGRPEFIPIEDPHPAGTRSGAGLFHFLFFHLNASAPTLRELSFRRCSSGLQA